MSQACAGSDRRIFPDGADGALRIARLPVRTLLRRNMNGFRG